MFCQILGALTGGTTVYYLNYPLFATRDVFTLNSVRALASLPHPDLPLGFAILNEVVTTALFLTGIFVRQLLLLGSHGEALVYCFKSGSANFDSFPNGSLLSRFLCADTLLKQHTRSCSRAIFTYLFGLSNLASFSYCSISFVCRPSGYIH